MNKDELTTARREAERRLRRYDLGERVYDEETISVCKAVPYLIDENAALLAEMGALEAMLQAAEDAICILLPKPPSQKRLSPGLLGDAS